MPATAGFHLPFASFFADRGLSPLLGGGGLAAIRLSGVGSGPSPLLGGGGLTAICRSGAGGDPSVFLGAGEPAAIRHSGVGLSMKVTSLDVTIY
jgi:hypothetical protein